MGLSPVTFQEIEAYSRLNGLDFLPIEVNTIMEMSRAYVRYVSDKDNNAKAPFTKSDIITKT